MCSCPDTDIDPTKQSSFPPWGSPSFPFLFLLFSFFFFFFFRGWGWGGGAGFNCLEVIPNHFYLLSMYVACRCLLQCYIYIYITCTDPATDIYQGACSRVSRAYIARRMLLPQDLLLRRRVSPCGFFRAQRLHSIILLLVLLFILSKAR